MTSLRLGRALLLGVGAVVGISAVTSTTQASLIAVARNSSQQSLNTGSLSLNVTRDGASGGWTESINSLAPGDTQYRYIKITQGSSAASNPTLSITDSLHSLLSTDSMRGIAITINSCSQPWVYSMGSQVAGSCGGVATNLISNSLSALATPVSFGINTTSGGVSYLQIKYFLPLVDSESVTDGGDPVVTGSGHTYFITAENSFTPGVETLYTSDTSGLTVGQIIVITYDGPGTSQNVYSYTVSGNPVTSINPNISFTVNAGGSGYFTTPLVGRTSGGSAPSILGLSANLLFTVTESQRVSAGINQ